MPYICYTHHGLYEPKPNGDDGCNNEECLAFARKEIRPVGIHVAGFAGSTATKVSRLNSDNFHRDMYAYKDAVDQGVRPEQVTKKAAEVALKVAEAKEHGSS